MGSPKTNVRWGAMAKVESVYATPVALSASTDAIDLYEEPEADPDYAHNGERHGKSPASHGGRKRVGRMGRFADGVTLKMEPAGAGSAYASNNLPNVHTLMRGAGFAPTLVTTSGSESVAYAPHAVDAEESLTVELYRRKEKHPLCGWYSDFVFDLDLHGIPSFEFAGKGAYSALPSDVAFPSFTLPTIEPPKGQAVNFSVTIGGTTFVAGKIKKLRQQLERNIAARASDNVTGNHGGFNVGAERVFTLEAIIEATTLPGSPYISSTAANPWELMERGTVMALAFSVGATQYRKFDFAAATAQLIEAPSQLEGTAAMWALKFHCLPSSLTANDEVLYTFN